SLILLVAAGCCGLFLLSYVRGAPLALRRILLIHLCLAGILLASIVLSLLISRGFQELLGVGPNYIQHFFTPERLIQDPAAVLGRVARQYWAVYGGKRGIYGAHYITFPALLLLGMAALTLQAPGRRAVTMPLLILYMLGITLLPFAINFVGNGRLPPRI